MRNDIMANALVNIRMPADLLKDAENIVKTEGFGTTQEFVREAVREHVRKYKRQQALLQLDRLAGSAKSKKLNPLNKKQRNLLAQQS